MKNNFLPYVLLLSISFLFLYLPVWRNLISTWSSDDDYSHGFFIVPLVCFIAWRKRGTLQQTRIEPGSWGLGLIILSLVLYLLATTGEIITVASISLVLVSAGVIWYLFGKYVLRELAFCFLLLLFMIPIPSQIYSTLTVPLQLLVSQLSTMLARSMGVPIFREGNVIFLSDWTLQVVQACSGLRSIMSLLTLSAVFGYLTLRSNLLRLLLLLSSIPAAILVNIFRVSMMIFAYQYFSYDLTAGTTHTVFGLLIFFISLALIASFKGVLSIWEKT
ncbi:MAG: exosortase [Thermodesulfobacteriota bacterium]